MEAQPLAWIEQAERLRSKCLELAATIASLALARLSEHDLGALAVRQDEQLRDAIHDFAFRARKLIEIAKRAKCVGIDSVDLPSIVASSVDELSPRPGRPLSLVDVLGRIIHSDAFDVLRDRLPRESGECTAGSSGWAFVVASDRDRGNAGHLVFVEFFLRGYLEFDQALEHDLRLMRTWLPAG